jgi:hypothetical protein
MEDITDKLIVMEREKAFIDSYNPMHLYAQLVDNVLSSKDSLSVTKYYEELFYRPLIDLIIYKNQSFLNNESNGLKD